jgi:hypothetical protein
MTVGSLLTASTAVGHARVAGRAHLHVLHIFGRVRGGLWRVHLPRLPIPVMVPKRRASASPEPSTAGA